MIDPTRCPCGNGDATTAIRDQPPDQPERIHWYCMSCAIDIAHTIDGAEIIGPET